jgi:hypothetical protein
MATDSSTQPRPATADAPIVYHGGGAAFSGHTRRSSWRCHAAAYLHWLEGRCRLAKADAAGEAQLIVQHCERGLAVARTALDQRPRWREAWAGTHIDMTYYHLHLVDGELIPVDRPGQLAGRREDVLAQVRRYLPAEDARRRAVEEKIEDGASLDGPAQRQRLSCALLAAHAASDDAHRRLRGLRNTLIISLGVLGLLGLALTVAGVVWPDAVSLCFTNEFPPVCPGGTGGPSAGDTALVLAAGLLGSAVVGVGALRYGRGTGSPYRFPLLLLMLKLPLGALTGWLGILLIHGEFIPGLSQLDTSGQILAWATVFGAGQQAVSRLVDRRAQEALDDTRGHLYSGPGQVEMPATERPPVSTG